MTHSSDSPSSQWRRQHGDKKRHCDRVRAELHAMQQNARFGVPGQLEWMAYPCRWGDWYFNGRVAPEHWHVGRPPAAQR